MLLNTHTDNVEDYIPSLLNINTYKYADDCTQDEVIPYGCTSNTLAVLDAINDWALRNKMKLNAKRLRTCGSVLKIQFLSRHYLSLTMRRSKG